MRSIEYIRIMDKDKEKRKALLTVGADDDKPGRGHAPPCVYMLF